MIEKWYVEVAGEKLTPVVVCSSVDGRYSGGYDISIGV